MPSKVPAGWYDISVPLKQGMNYLPLDPVPAGEYELLCLSLLMYKGDAGPCRAILRPMR